MVRRSGRWVRGLRPPGVGVPCRSSSCTVTCVRRTSWSMAVAAPRPCSTGGLSPLRGTAPSMRPPRPGSSACTGRGRAGTTMLCWKVSSRAGGSVSGCWCIGLLMLWRGPLPTLLREMMGISWAFRLVCGRLRASKRAPGAGSGPLVRAVRRQRAGVVPGAVVVPLRGSFLAVRARGRGSGGALQEQVGLDPSAARILGGGQFQARGLGQPGGAGGP